jgi:hypothetical protein
MNDKEGLNLLDYLPTGIDKTDPVIQAIFSDGVGNGAIANELDKLVDYIGYYTANDDVQRHHKYTLEMIARLFAKIRRQIQEDDARLLRRMLALTERTGDTIWGNASNMEHVFEMYFMGIKAYVCENTNFENLIENGDFEDDDVWEFEGSVEYTNEARFSGKRGLFFSGMPGSCSQTLEHLPQAVYTLHFFLSGKCGVKIRNEHGKYWNAKAEPNNYILQWEDDEVINYFKSDDWKDVYCFVVLQEGPSLMKIEFVPVDGKIANIDYVRLFEKPLNSSYSIVVQYEGYKLSERTLHLGEGQDDPIDGVNYDKESYFDHSYIIGRHGAYRNEVYEALLNSVRPRGIQAFVEFVEKTYLEDTS